MIGLPEPECQGWIAGIRSFSGMKDERLALHLVPNWDYNAP